MKELIYDTNKTIVVPTEWNELSPKQLILLAGLLHSNLPETHKITRALHICSGMGKLKFALLKNDVIVNASSHINWVFEENTLTNQLLPQLGNFYGPDSNFDNLKMCEFNHAEMAYREIIETKQPEYLDRLVAILYRPGKENYDHKRNPDSDHRIPFMYGDISWNMGKVARSFSENEKHAILLWYDGCRQELIKIYDEVFSKKGSSDENMHDGLFPLMHSVAGDKYGNFDEVENSYVHKILMALTIMIKEVKAIEKQSS